LAGFVFSSDWHLSRLTWSHRPRLTGDSSCSFWQIIRYCLDRRLPLLAAGDLFDKDRPDPESVACLVVGMDLMQKAELPVYYIQGQHERDVSPWLDVHDWPVYLDGESIEIPGVAGGIYGLDWTPADKIVSRLAEVPNHTRFLMCHQVWAEHMGSLCNPECDLGDVPATVEYVLSGDFHQHVRTGRMVSPGSISMRNLAEPPAKYFWVFDADRNEFSSVPLVTRPFLSMTVTNELQFQQFVTALDTSRRFMEGAKLLDSEPLCRVRYSDELPDAYRRITAAAGTAHLFLDEIVTTVAGFADTVDTSLASGSDTLLACLSELLPAEHDIRRDVVSLLTSTKPPMLAVRELMEETNAGQ